MSCVLRYLFLFAFVFLSFLFLVICSLICVYRKISFLYHLLCYDSHSSSNQSRIVFVFILLLSRFVSPVSARRLCQCLCHCFVPNLVLFFFRSKLLSFNAFRFPCFIADLRPTTESILLSLLSFFKRGKILCL